MIGYLRRWLFVITITSLVEALLWISRRLDGFCVWLVRRLQDQLEQTKHLP